MLLNISVLPLKKQKKNINKSQISRSVPIYENYSQDTTHQVIRGEVSLFCLFLPQNWFKFQRKQRVMSESLLRHCTLLRFGRLYDDLFSHNANTCRDHSFSGVFWSSHTALTCLRLGIGVGHRNTWAQCDREGSNTLAWSHRTVIPEGETYCRFFRVFFQLEGIYWRRQTTLSLFVVSQ